jgi:feruloyl esterase
LIDDPRACNWQPAAMACRAKSSDTCLTQDEVKVLEKWYAGPRTASGTPLYPGGIPRGSEPFWPLWLTGDATGRSPPLVPLFARDFLRYMAFAEDPGEAYDVRGFDFARDPARLIAMARVYNADNPDLGAFAARGGKIIVYHGWADPIVTPHRTIRYVEDVQRTMGGKASTDQFLRLFMLPGFDHCGIQTGPGANDAGFDPLPALEAWVERGVPPDAIPMNRDNPDGSTAWSRAVCAYPPAAACKQN